MLEHRPIAMSTPMEPQLQGITDDEFDHNGHFMELESIIDETEKSLDEHSSTEVEEPMNSRPSDTIPPDLFYPVFAEDPESKVSIKPVNRSITHKKKYSTLYLSR